MELTQRKISKFIEAFNQRFWLRMFFFLSLLLIIWSIRFPFIFRKIYAEDGGLYLADALKFKFPTDLFEPSAGYSTLIMRLGGRFVSLFPLEYAAIMCGVFTAICLSVLAAGLYKYNDFNIKNIHGRFALSLCFIFLPLASFSAVGNIANLYVYFMTAAGVFLYYHEKTPSETFYKSFIFLIATLSLPLTIFLLPLISHRIYLDKKISGSWKLLKSDFVFAIGIVFQITFIAVKTFGERAPHAPQSLFKVIYLYLDRGIGISTIPKWGFVSNSNGIIQYENSLEFLHSTNVRSAVVLVVLALFILTFYKNISNIPPVIRAQLWFITSLGFIYSMLVGLFFNSEPRYMIFTSFLTCWAILLLLDSISNLKLKLLSTNFLVLVLAVGLTGSIHRSQGP